MKRIFLLVCLLIGLGSLMAQTGQEFWGKLSPTSVFDLNRQKPMPTAFKSYTLNLDQLKTLMAQAPEEGNAQGNSLTITLPGPDNNWIDFEIVQTMVMPSPLAAKFPEIKTFLGWAKNDPYTFVRLDYTYQGFHAKIRSTEYTWWIEPVSLSTTTSYLAFYQKDSNDPGFAEGTSCGTEDDDHVHENRPGTGARNGSGETLRTYTAAFASDETWTALNGGINGAMSAITTTTNFLNDILERDFAIRFILAANNDTIVFDSNTDPYTSNNPPLNGSYLFAMINENTGVLNNYIGSANYDIGHVFNELGPGGAAGVAFLRGLCNGSNKGGGASTASGPAGTGFWLVFSHEIGHQLGANHTFHSELFECSGGNRSASSAYEPGNGSTIMGYPRCEPVGGRDFYFHVHSFQEGFAHTNNGGGNTCATRTATGNLPPIVEAGEGGWVIPISTPFRLVGSASDPDGDPITYCWQQYNRGAPSVLTNPVGNVPIFRVFPPTTDSARVFPRIQDIVSGVGSPGERLPTYSRNLTFRLDVRDNNTPGGGRAYDEVSFTASDQAGPFEVIYPGASSPTITVGDPLAIEWDVANTDQAPVNCQKVDILLSRDGGFTYDIVLAEDIPNNGTFTLCTPNFPGTLNRIQVRAADNIFFNISPANFTIASSGSAGFSFFSNTDSLSLCKEGTSGANLTSCEVGNSNEKFGLRAIGLPPGVTFRAIPDSVSPGQPFDIVLEAGSITPVGTYAFSVAGSSPSGASSLEFFDLEVFAAFVDFPTATGGANINDASANPTLSWSAVAGANGYYYELASDPNFTNILSSGNVSGTSVSISNNLTSLTSYYWRVAAVVECGNGPFSQINSFRTGSCNRVSSTDVPKTIDAFGSLPITALSTLSYTGPNPTDVNVFVEGTHDNVKDLSVSVISPAGIELSLFTSICNVGDKDFNLVFDSEASISNANIPCPPTTGDPVRPLQSFNFFYGQNPTGTWTLRVRDFEAFNGGEITSWGIEFCQPVNSDLQLINNNTLGALIGASSTIPSANLRSQASNTPDTDVVYTLVTLPSTGDITLNGNVLNAGDSFTQDDVENGRVGFAQNGTNAAGDTFDFIVEDQSGGWIGVNQFTIALGTSIDPLNNFQVIARPNPTKDLLFVDLLDINAPEAALKLVDLRGKTISSKSVQVANGNANASFDLSSLPSGIYLLEVQSNGSKRVSKIVKN
ncbi:MAG: M12 family metallo-peptidase [Bacteroidia bacterium]|nr:M12 family metallo-peptidase [Bacteroidia bacterium]